MNHELKIAILLQQFDESAFQIFQHAVIPDVDKLNYDRYIVHMRDRFVPGKVSENLGSILGQQDNLQHSRLTCTMNRLLGWHKKHFQGTMPTSWTTD